VFYLFIYLFIHCGEGFALAKQVLYHLSHSFGPFYSCYFGDEVLKTICPGWPQTSILPFSTSQVTTIYRHELLAPSL
jgi:hypothetical protein